MTTPTIIVLFHSADFDGIFCREIAKRFFGDKATYVGWDYGQPDPVIPDGIEHIYMLDISIKSLMKDPRLVWIDHHRTAMDEFGNDAYGYRLDGVAACRLAWQWFFCTYGPNGDNRIHPTDWQLPDKQMFIDRTVQEPWAVRLAGEYDIWDKRDPDAELFQHGLRSQNLDSLWEIILQNPIPEVDEKRGLDAITVDALLDAGRAIQYAKTEENAGIITSYGFTINWEGLCFLCCNHARFNSHLFKAATKPEHDGLLGFNFDGSKGDWRVSLYGVPGKPEVDLGAIAKKYGGGGHRQACGMRISSLDIMVILHKRA